MSQLDKLKEVLKQQNQVLADIQEAKANPVPIPAVPTAADELLVVTDKNFLSKYEAQQAREKARYWAQKNARKK